MQPGKRISWMLVPLLLLVLGSTGCFVVRQLLGRQTQNKIQTLEHIPAALQAVVVDLDGYVLVYQQAIIQSADGNSPAIKTVSNPAETFRKYLSAAKPVDAPNDITVKKITESLENLVSLGKSLTKAMGSDAGALPDDEKGIPSEVPQLALALSQERSASVMMLRELAEAHNQKLQSLKASQGVLQWLYAGGALGGLAILYCLVLFGLVGKVATGPIKQFLEDLKNRKKLPEGPTDLGKLATHLNLINREFKETEVSLEQLGDGNFTYEVSPLRHAEGVSIAMKRLSVQLQRMPQLTRESQALKTDLDEKAKAYAEKDKTLKRLETELHTATERLQAIERTLVVAELDAEGRFVYADRVFTNMAGYQADELNGKELTNLNGPNHDQEFFQQLWSTVKQGDTWYGVLKNQKKNGQSFWLASAVTPINGNGSGSRYLLAGYEISSLKQGEEQLRKNLQQVTDQLSLVRKNLESVQSEHQQVLESFGYQKSLENRLVQQQSALQELTRNVDLKEGNVHSAVRFITETTAHAILGERVGLWLFTDHGTKIRCLDLYDRQHKSHTGGYEITRLDYPKLFENWQGERVIAASDAQNDPATSDLSETYLGPNGIQSLLSAPIHLGGTNVGIMMVEHLGQVRSWSLDEENFILAVADNVSLALEQGNRKVMEEELRMTLEESQALEEELRQNAEEIEATNEEMRRTQVELRGQINALNNAALVAETNIHGSITYANLEFAKIYGYDRKEVLGQNHRMLKSELHPAAFYAHMWDTITNGKVWKGEVLNLAQDGRKVWALLTITPVLGIDGKPYKYIGVSYNVTAQKGQELQLKAALGVALDQEEALKSANDDMRRTQIELTGQINALNNSSMVYETDMEGNITYANAELLEVSGYAEADIIGHRYNLLKSGNQPDSLYNEQWKTVLKGQIWQGELELKNRSGKIFWVVATSTPVLDEAGQAIKAINVLVEITQQKTMEFRLKNQQSALLNLTSNPAIKEGNVDEAFKLLTQIGRETLGAFRASLWLYQPESTQIRCVSVSELGDHSYPVGTLIDRATYPVYFRTLERDRVLAANKAQQDPRTRELAETVFHAKGITAVLDATVRLGGNIVGVFSLEHRDSSREWTPDELTFATSLADTAGLVLEQKERLLVDRLKLAYTQLEEKNQEVMRAKAEIEDQAAHLTHSIRYAKRIQNNILPAKEFIDQYIENWFVVYRPKDIVGGDFYWFGTVGRKMVIVIADGTGHGVPGAFMTLIGYLLLNDIVAQKGITKPSEILYHLHRGVRTALKQDEEGTESRDGMDVAICSYDPDTRVAEYAGANLPFNYYTDWELHVIKPDKKSIGGEQMEEERIFMNHTVQLKPGDGIYMYTDGFVDQMGGPEDKRYSTKRFRDLVLRTQQETMSTQRALINLEWKEWKDDREQLDDVTLFGMKIQ